jgi:hypothetical protein
MNKKNIARANHLLTEINECYEQLTKPDVKVEAIQDPELILSQLERYDKWLDILNDFLDKQRPREMSEEVPSENSEEQQHLMQKAKEIEHAGVVLECAFATALKNRKRKKGKTKLGRHVKERKKLFKTIGGDEKWIPL